MTSFQPQRTQRDAEKVPIPLRFSAFSAVESDRDQPASSLRTMAAPAASACSLPKAVARGMYFMPQSGAGMTRSSFYRQQQGPQKFKPGDKVRTKNIHPATHTRLPRYARDKVGVVELCHGCHMYPDSVATDKGDDPQWLYTVVFDGREIWGPDTDPTLKVSIDAFEPYLEPADAPG